MVFWLQFLIYLSSDELIQKKKQKKYGLSGEDKLERLSLENFTGIFIVNFSSFLHDDITWFLSTNVDSIS